VFLLGGRLFKHSAVTCGAAAAEAANSIAADLFFLGVTGVHPVHGLTTGDADEAAMKRTLAGRAAGDLDVLVSNAGETVRAPLESVPLAEVERLFGLNTLGALRVAQGVLPAMRKRGAGRLVFVSSIQGRLVLPLIGPYGASKWALEALAETLAIEVRHFGVKVSIVQPGVVSSGGAERAKVFLAENDPYAPLYQALHVLRGESVTPQDVAAAVADTIEKPEPALRVPVGLPAERALQARKQAPEDEPFLTAEIGW
jgi:NAD(P)-dependent dehydrogenase (short-subunit alcohol dehydrogenase family)